MPGLQVESPAFDDREVGRCLPDGDILAIVGHEPVHSLLVLLLGGRVIAFGHTDVPEDVFVARCRDQRLGRQLQIVVIGPLCDDLELLFLRVVVHLELAAAQLARLESHPLDQPADLVLIRIERDVGVGEIPDRKGLAVIAHRLLVAYRADLSDAPGEDTLESCLLIVLDDAEPGVLLDIFHPAGQLQAGMAVIVGIDIARGTHREEPREELHTVGCSARNAAYQSVTVRQRDGLAELAARDIEGHAVEPPFCFCRRGELGKCIGGVFARVFDIDVLRDDYFADFPFCCTGSAIHVRDNERGMFACRSRKCQYGIVVILRIDHQGLTCQSFSSGHTDRIGPFPPGVHLRQVTFENPIAPTFEICIVIYFERYTLERSKGDRQNTLFLNTTGTGPIISGSDR